MYESTQDAMWGPGIDLAQEADFDLGALRVRPARCSVEWNGVSQTLQRRVMQVLVALAQARGSVVSQTDLVARCWRGLSVSDDAIYRCISKLRKLAADYPHPPYEIEAIPGVGYRLTSAGRADDGAAIDRSTPRENRFRFRAATVAAVLAILALVAAAVWTNARVFGDGHHPVRVVVQPFEALTNSDDARALARRIPNEVVDVLGDGQIEALLAAEPPKAGNSANPPGLIVTGIVRDDGGNTIVDLRLEDGTTRTALWSTEFKRGSREASDLPLEVAARVADVVNIIDFARNANPPLTDDSALTGLIQSLDMLRGASDESSWAPMLQKTQDIVTRHPEFALGHSQLAAAYAWAAENADPDQAQVMRDAARREANLTLNLDPQDAGAYIILSGFVAPYDYRAAEAIFLRGTKFAKHPKQPLAGMYSYYGILLGNVGRLREALSFQLIAHAKDEWGPARTTKLAGGYASVGDLAAARDSLQKAAQYWPNHPGVWRWQQYIAGFYEPPSDALAVLKRLDARGSLSESNAIWRAFIEAKVAHSERATEATSSKVRAAADSGIISRENEIMMLAVLGQTKQAIEIANSVLDRQRLEPSPLFAPVSAQRLEPWFLFTPVTRDLRRDPGFIPLASRFGLIKYWRDTGKWPDFCTDRTPECSPQLLAAIRRG